ncbi:MAG: FAD-dependent oxidoreductase [bacterium]|nr:FAD-dependent oxidoreductase [bacterium]
MHHVIIGNSAAGIGAAEAIRQIDKEAPLTIISDESESAYSRALISYELAGWIGKGNLDLRPREFYQEKNIAAHLGKRAIKIDAGKKQVHLNDGSRVDYDRLLIATGGSPQQMGVPGEDKKGIFGFRNYRDLLNIYDAIITAEHGVVLGGGCIGLQAASGLHHHGVKTSIAIASAHLLSQVADAECGDIYQRLFESNGIAIKTSMKPVEFRGVGQVGSIGFDDGSEMPAQIVISGKGVKPNTELAEGTKIKVDRGIIVDDRMCTAEPDVFAAGDVAVTQDCVTCESTVNAVWPCAYEQGRTAGFNMAGRDRVYDGSMRMNAAEFFRVPLISIGVVKPQGDGYEVHSYLDKSRMVYWKMVFKGKLLVGAVLVGRVERAGVLANLMRKHIDVSSIKGELLAGRYNYALIKPLAEGAE